MESSKRKKLQSSDTLAREFVTDIVRDVSISEGQRKAKVATIKAQVQNGTYDFSSERVAEALLKKIL